MIANPVVKVTPDQRVFRGETVTLTCDIQGGGRDTQWTYSWFKDGLLIPNSTERVYNITSNVSVSGNYRCEAKRSEFSAAISLHVLGEFSYSTVLSGPLLSKTSDN